MANPSFLAKLTQVDRRLIYVLMTLATALVLYLYHQLLRQIRESQAK